MSDRPVAASTRFLALPNLPDSTACVFLQQRPRVASVSSQETPWTFAEGAGTLHVQT